MVKFKIIFVILLSATLFGCIGQPPTEFGKQVLEKVEAQKLKSGKYPETVEGNLVDKGYTKIETNDFFYIVDSTRTSFTLNVFNANGLSDVYDSKTKHWTRTDK